MNKIINQIAEKDRVFSRLCNEAESSYKNKNYFSALACLFVISEQIIKYALNDIDGNFYQATQKAKEQKIITNLEYETINILRKFRNKIFHENHYSLGIKIEGINYPIDEDSTKKLIYDLFSTKLFQIVLKFS